MRQPARGMALAGGIVFGLATALVTGRVAGQGPTRGERVVLDNERVRVVEFVLEPGVTMGRHTHPRDRVEITLSGGRVRVTTEDGRAQEVDEKQGTVVFNKANPAPHDVANVGPTTIRAYHVELK